MNDQKAQYVAYPYSEKVKNGKPFEAIADSEQDFFSILEAETDTPHTSYYLWQIILQNPDLLKERFEVSAFNYNKKNEEVDKVTIRDIAADSKAEALKIAKTLVKRQNYTAFTS